MDKLPRGVVRGQLVNPTKVERARELRGNPTPAEALLWERLRRQQLGGFSFRRQQVIAGFIADFYCNAARLVIELDGSVHDNQVEADHERSIVIQGHQLRVLRFRNAEVERDVEVVCRSIHEACLKAAGSTEG